MTRYRTSFDTDEQAVVEALFLGLMALGESEAEAASALTASWPHNGTPHRKGAES